jgi:hypothetical protein
MTASRPPPAAAVGSEEPRDRGMPPWMPIVLGFGGALILGIGVLLVLLLTREDPALADASASPSASASVEASAGSSGSAAASQSATPEPSPSPTPRPALANRSIAEVTADAELRTQPGGGEVIGSLLTGSRIFVIGTPQDADSRWYRVAVVQGPYTECQNDVCPNDIGYLADGTSEADAVLAAVNLECPQSPMDSATLDMLLPLERLACYGGSPITVTGTLDHCYCDGPIGATYNPQWLAAPVVEFLFNGAQTLWVRFERGADAWPEDLEAGDIVETTMSMEHDAAPECTTDSPETSTADIVLYCRTQLVVEELTVTGHDDAIGP